MRCGGGNQAPPVLAQRAHKAGQIVISAGDARRMRTVGGILVFVASGMEM